MNEMKIKLKKFEQLKLKFRVVLERCALKMKLKNKVEKSLF